MGERLKKIRESATNSGMIPAVALGLSVVVLGSIGASASLAEVKREVRAHCSNVARNAGLVLKLDAKSRGVELGEDEIGEEVLRVREDCEEALLMAK